MYKIELSQIVKRKIKALKLDLAKNFSEESAKKTVSAITKSIRQLETFQDKGVSISEMYDIDTDYSYIFTHHNYFIYRVEKDKVIIVNMFHEKEDFMAKLFGISGRTQESIDYWGE